MQRLPDWRQRFERFIDEVKATPFAYGSFDCAVAFAGGMTKALTGEDVVAPWRGRYQTRAEGVALIRAAGFGQLGDMVSSLLPEWEHPSRMRIGDVVAVPATGPFGIALGICNGGGAIFVLREEGLGVMNQTAAVRAWRVGDV